MVCGPATPHSPFGSYGLGWSDFARHYSRNHGCFLFLWVLRWFTSPGSLHTAMYSRYDNPYSYGLGSPIRTSPDHRLLASPRSFSQLTTSFIAYLRQGIHTHALSSLTIKFTLDTEFFLYFSKLPLTLMPTKHQDGGSYAPHHILVSWWSTYLCCIQLLSGGSPGATVYCPSEYSIFKDQFRLPFSNQDALLAFTRRIQSPDSCILVVFCFGCKWWAWIDSNYRPHPYQGCALAT